MKKNFMSEQMQGISWMKISKVIILSLFVLLIVGETVSATNLSADTTVFTIAKNGKTNYCIIVPDKASPVIEYAAGELQRFLKEISGARLSIIPASSAREGHAFLIGLSKRVRKAGLEDELGKLKEDGVLVKTIGKDVVLLGQNDRGQIYSVYVFLERFLGVRFLAWDCTVVPKRRMLTLPSIDYAYSPPFMSREVYYYNALPKQIAARQRLNGSSTECDSTVGGKIT
ncbi:MAG: alpha-glucuronidase family glycosyl hydrolase, partial [Bacteroidales bacterium]|nr:alpha-glucuronidase family glycosyl hydrolase [Bacteroidales bacterium]